MELFDLTEILRLLIGACALVVTGVIVPLVRRKLGAADFDELLRWVRVFVAAAEQLYDAADGAKKKRYVLEKLEERGYSVAEESLDSAIEAAVLELHSALKGGAE